MKCIFKVSVTKNASIGLIHISPGLIHISPGLKRISPGLNRISPGIERISPGIKHISTDPKTALIGLKNIFEALNTYQQAFRDNQEAPGKW